MTWSGGQEILAADREATVGRSAKESYRRLLTTAGQQQGLFTAKQAGEAGYSDAARVYHVKSGNWLRKARGVYQLVDYPNTERPDLALWSLWSRGVDDVPVGVYSHQTALSIHELTDLQPAKLHMSVPMKFRRRSAIPKILVLHWQDLPVTDIIEMEGYCVTRPLRAIVDLLQSGEVHPGILQDGIKQGMDRGLITIAEVRKALDAGLLSPIEVDAE
ncbi:MAG: type IV toxin-antitoxin system AbiEi family antitoxin domain-containing protein [Pseudomonadota bacterium]